MDEQINDKVERLSREWDGLKTSQTDRVANAKTQIGALNSDAMPKYNQLFSAQKITPALINTAILGKRERGRLMELNNLFALFMESDDNLIHCVNLTKETLKKASWKYDRKLTKAQTEWLDKLIRNNLKGWIDIFVDGKLWGYQFWQILYGQEADGQRYRIAETIDYHDKNLDLRIAERKLGLFMQDKPVELDFGMKFISRIYKQSILQSILKYYVFYAFAINNWAQFTETYGKPPRIGTYEPTASAEEVALLKRMVTDLGTDQAAVIAKTCNIEFKDFSGKTTSADLFERLCNFVEGRVTKAILGQTLTTNAAQYGTQALGTVQNEVRKDIRDGYLGDLGDMVNEVLGRLALLNGDAVTGVEFFIHEPVNQTDRMTIVTGAARLGLKIGTSYVYDTFEIPKPAEGEELLVVPSPVAPGVPPEDTPPEESPAAETNKDKKNNRIPPATPLMRGSAPHPGRYLNAAIDELAPVLMAIRQKIRGCETLEQLQALTIYQEAAALGEKLGVGVTKAYVAGRQRNRRKGESVVNYELRIMNYELNRIPPATQLMQGSAPHPVTNFVGAEIQFGWAEQDVELVNVFRTQVMTISGVRTDEQLKILKEAAIAAMEDSGSFHDYIRNADLAGFSPENPYHFRTEYDTAFGAAQMAGQWQGIQADQDIFPYLRYVTMQDDLVREEHAALDGYIAAVEDPFWLSNYPPNGWNCRCDVEQLMQDEAEADPKYGQAPEEVPVMEQFASNAGMTGSLPNNTDADFEKMAYDYIAARLPEWAVKPKYDEPGSTTKNAKGTKITIVMDWAGYPVAGAVDVVTKDMIARPGEVWQIAGNGLLILKKYDSYTGILVLQRGKCGACVHEKDNSKIDARRRGMLVYGT